MKSTRSEAAASVALRPARDGRLVPYSLLAVGGLAGAVLAGQAALAAMAVPFMLALALGLRRTGPVAVTARLSLDADQVLQGDVVSGRLTLDWDGDFDVEVALHRLTGVECAPAGELAWALPRGSARREFPVALRATRWGRHEVAEAWVRMRPPFGLLSWTGKVLVGPTLRVLPDAERLDRLLDPSESRAVWGVHPSRRLGDGHEFAELSPYVPGDRLRDLNWAATARRGRPFVNRRHPDLSGDVVIALDAFDDDSVAAGHAWSRAARGAWALASVHLRANDRVGLAGLGGSTQWLPPASGRRARYRLLQTLLDIGGEAARAGTAGTGRRRVAVPAAALIIVLTQLQDDDVVGAIAAWRARGRRVAVVLIDTSDLLPQPRSEAESLARRIWRLDRDRRGAELARLGVPRVTASTHEPTGPLIAALRRAGRAPAVRRAP